MHSFLSIARLHPLISPVLKKIQRVLSCKDFYRHFQTLTAMEAVEGRRVCRVQTTRPSPSPSPPMFKKVQVVYYLSRNGHLEHPHYMEVTHLAHHQLRLKDVLDRLRNLRGKAMPSFYSWSCKRSYKNGYVWNDLSENDAIYPSEGNEFVLKGSHLIDASTDKLHTIQLGSAVQQDPKIKPLAFGNRAGPGEYEDQEMEGEEEEEEEDEHGIKTDKHVSHSRCSRGVSTDEILDTTSFSSPPSTTSSDTIIHNNNISKRLGDGGSPAAPLVGRNSMLLSLIACGGSASFRKSAAGAMPAVVSKESPARKSGGCGKDAAMMIGCMSENPRFGGEEKEYFSGSIVESVGNQSSGDVLLPVLKKSSSYNEERSKVGGLGEVAKEEEDEWERDNNGVKGMKCIPRKKTSSKQSKK